MAIKKVGVVGGGLMGSGIAQTAAQAGYDVIMAEVNQELLDRGIGRVEGAWKMLSGKGRISEEQASEYRGRFRGTLNMEDFSDRDLVIEAIIENQDEKRKLFAQLDKITPKKALLVSNTSSLPIIEMAAATGRPGQVAGLHFFNPAPVMKLVEIVRTIETSDETVEQLRELCREARQDADHRQGHRRLRRQLPADPLHALGGAHVREWAGDQGRHRYRDEARLRLPDGALSAPRLRWAGHHALRRRGDLQGVSRPGLRAADAAAAHGAGGTHGHEERQGLLRLS